MFTQNLQATGLVQFIPDHNDIYQDVRNLVFEEKIIRDPSEDTQMSITKLEGTLSHMSTKSIDTCIP